jgi:hypothetical protein
VLSRATNFRKPQTTLSSSGSFTQPAATKTKPTGTGVIDLSSLAKQGADEAFCTFIGTGDADDVYNFRLISWSIVPGDNSNADLWVPTTLADLVITLGTATGADGTLVPSTCLFADTITITKEPTITADTTRQGTIPIFSPANNTIAWAKIPLHGAQLIERIFDTDTGNPTGCDVLMKLQ